MTGERILALVEQMAEACRLAVSYIQGIDRESFRSDTRTQQAIAMNLVVIGEAVARLEARHADFVQAFPNVPWQSMRGMRNRIAHGYFELDIDIVFDTAALAIPSLLNQMPALLAAASSFPRDTA